MLGAIRRYGVVQALRASTPRSLSARSIPQLSRWQTPATVLPQTSRSLFHSSSFRYSAANAAQVQENDSELLTEFSDLAKTGLVDPRVINTLTRKMNITTMTDVQRLTINQTVKGGDVLAQAKTGTGKTLAFLLPVIQNILNDETVSLSQRRRYGSNDPDIRSIIISPTRELAEQIAVEANKVAQGTGIVVQTAVGGTQKALGLRRMRTEGCHLLIGTPGRLKDLLSDPRSGIKAPKLSTFVLDEADRLLDDGFSEEILEIQGLLPDPMSVDRQTLLFSATVAPEVMHMVRRTLKPNFKFVKTVRDDETPTHLSVPQKLVPLNGFENALPAIFELIENYQAAAKEDSNLRPFKAIAYFNSTAQTTMAFNAFRNLREQSESSRGRHPIPDVRPIQIHSRLTQARRTVNADDFRKSKSALLFSSDVTARGMDFPEVTHVIQIGSPRDRATYIHRLGRTARANKKGEGWAFLHKSELATFDKKLGDLPILTDQASIETAKCDMKVTPFEDHHAPEAARVFNLFKSSMESIDEELKSDAFKGQLGTLIGVIPRKTELVGVMNNLAVHGYGLAEPPVIAPKMLENLGLKRDGNKRSRRDDAFGRSPRRSGDRGRGGYERSDRYSDGGARFAFGGRSQRGQRNDSRPQRSSRLDRYYE